MIFKSVKQSVTAIKITATSRCWRVLLSAKIFNYSLTDRQSENCLSHTCLGLREIEKNFANHFVVGMVFICWVLVVRYTKYQHVVQFFYILVQINIINFIQIYMLLLFFLMKPGKSKHANITTEGIKSVRWNFTLKEHQNSESKI